jgi:hypothetical protein
MVLTTGYVRPAHTIGYVRPAHGGVEVNQLAPKAVKDAVGVRSSAQEYIASQYGIGLRTNRLLAHDTFACLLDLRTGGPGGETILL